MQSLTLSTAKTLALMAVLLVVAGPLAAAKLYKWTDDDGKVHYTDQPPPAEAKVLEHKKFGDQPNEVPLPYSLQQAVKNFPVTLYSTDCGEGCTKASAFLTQRGVPFTEKNPRDPAIAEELEALTGGKLEVPVMKLGTQVLRGFDEGSWKTGLDAAGYPATAAIPVRAAPTTPKPAPVVAKPEAPAAAEPGAQDAPSEPASARQNY